MLIETYDHIYTVLQHLHSDPDMDSYVCRRKSDRQLYLIIRIRDKNVTNHIMEFICDQKNNKNFSDFIEYFVSEGDLHVVFAYAQGVPLQKKLEQPNTLKERMMLGKRILEKLILLGQPYYFICECLKPEHIVVTDAGEIGFRYTLEHVERYNTYTARQALNSLHNVLQLLFEGELRKNVLDPMETYLLQLLKEERLDCMAQYRLYNEVCEEILNMPEDDLAMPKNILSRFWESLKRVHGWIKKVMLPLIFIGVFIYMVYNIYMSVYVKDYVHHFGAIGTMAIEEEQPEE